MPKRKRKRTDLPARFEPGFLRELDHRSVLSRTLKGNYAEIVEDAGGEESLAHTKKALVERFVFLEAVLETLEQEIAQDPKGATEKLSRWIQALNSLTGLAKTIGTERVKKRVVSLKSYLKRGEDDE